MTVIKRERCSQHTECQPTMAARKMALVNTRRGARWTHMIWCMQANTQHHLQPRAHAMSAESRPGMSWTRTHAHVTRCSLLRTCVWARHIDATITHGSAIIAAVVDPRAVCGVTPKRRTPDLRLRPTVTCVPSLARTELFCIIEPTSNVSAYSCSSAVSKSIYLLHMMADGCVCVWARVSRCCMTYSNRGVLRHLFISNCSVDAQPRLVSSSEQSDSPCFHANITQVDLRDR